MMLGAEERRVIGVGAERMMRWVERLTDMEGDSGNMEKVRGIEVRGEV